MPIVRIRLLLWRWIQLCIMWVLFGISFFILLSSIFLIRRKIMLKAIVGFFQDIAIVVIVSSFSIFCLLCSLWGKSFCFRIYQRISYSRILNGCSFQKSIWLPWVILIKFTLSNFQMCINICWCVLTGITVNENLRGS